MQQSESIKNIMTALGQFQEAAIKIRKDSKNPFFKSKYASLSSILDEIQPELTKAKLAFTQLPQGSTHLETVLCHWETGEFISSNYDLNCVQTMPGDWAKIGKEFSFDIVPKELGIPIITPQALGSAITYARRYALTSILGLNIDDDDDGNAASGNATAEQKKGGNNQSPPQAQPPQQQPASQPQQQAPAITPFTKKYADANAILAVVKTAAKVDELSQLYFANAEFIEKNTSIKDAISAKRDIIKNQGKVIITNNQYEQVCDRIRKGDATVIESAAKVYILNDGQKDELQHLDKLRMQLEEALKLKYTNPSDIATLIDQCTTSDYVMRLHKNNSMIIDRDPELTNKINGKLRTLKTAA